MTILFLRLMLLLPALFPLPVRYHPLHVSTTELSFNAADKRLEATCTIFTDDFEAVLAKNYRTKADLSKPGVHAAMDGLVKRYISGHLRVVAGGKPVSFNYLGFEKASEAVNVYIESEPLLPPKKLEARVSILHDLYDDQMNIVHMTVGGRRKSTKLDFPGQLVSQVFE